MKKALKAVETILDTTRHPVWPDETDHTYDDKYALVEAMTNTAIASYVTVFEKLGLESMDKVVDWVQNEQRPVTLRFQMDQTCRFDKQTERKVVTAEQEIETTSGGSGIMGRSTMQTENVKVKTTIQEYHWKLSVPYKLVLMSGDDELELVNRENMTTTVVVSGGSKSDTQARPKAPWRDIVHTFDVNLTWLFQMIALTSGGEAASQFSIDRLRETCRTPGRNDDVQRALDFRFEASVWAIKVSGVFENLELDPSSPRVLRINVDEDIVSPIVPLFENATMLPKSDFDLFLTRHESTLGAAVDSLTEKIPSGGFISKNEAEITFLLNHLIRLLDEWKDTVAYVESMLKKQLIQAIGKEVTAQDFDKFMSFHTKKLLAPEYVPKPFSYSVRRENHYPDGMVSIEGQSSLKREPVETTVRHIPGDTNPSIFIPVNAATSVEIRGDRYVHGWMQHQWNGLNHIQGHYLVARAHQFSSFLVVLGIMDGPDKFIPKDATILQNKDEVVIPLLTTVLPSAKEFKDAISSLSPEQKAFAEAFRSIQLESSVFGICIIQIKPQLERLLSLPEGSLTKEIQLTQDLMSLFVDYQIPSDLLSFVGAADANVADKVFAVKGYVKAVMEVIESAKQKQLNDEKRKAEMRENVNGPRQESRSERSAHATRNLNGASSMKFQASSMMMKMGDVQPLKMGEAGSDEARTRSSPPQDEAFADESDSSSDSASASKEHQTKFDSSSASKSSSAEDFTLIPKLLDAKLEQLDKDGALKSTILKAGREWTRSRQENLLVSPKVTHLNDATGGVDSEGKKTMDLLTAISRSGSLPIDASELHIVIAVTHGFDRQIMNTIIEDNVNPIEKVEKSLLLVASTIHNLPGSELLIGEVPRDEIDGRTSI